MPLGQHNLQRRRNAVLIYRLYSELYSESLTEGQWASLQTQPCSQQPYFLILTTLLWVGVQTSQVPGCSGLAWYSKGFLSSTQAKINKDCSRGESRSDDSLYLFSYQKQFGYGYKLDHPTNIHIRIHIR